ncbi:MAG: glycosyltransferase family 4 protein, partial [Nitratireductor sp.]|nr:glycosyltransferase family 4 protein [Nitratireductor sp.]
VPLTEEMRKPPLQTTFVFAGRLSHEKGPDLFCALASRNRQSGRFEIHGDGPMRLELEQRYGDMVRFHGFTSDMKAALSQATALILTSRSEGLPMIALEAMAMGVPVIAPALGGLPDLVSHGSNGYLYEPQNLSALEDSLSCFRKLDRGQIAEMGMAARDVISAHYSPGAVLPELFRVYGRAGVKSERSTRTKVQSSIG